MQVYEQFKITGPIQVERVDKVRLTNSLAQHILILGPTGAGKSAFIEAIAGDKSLGISRDQLEGVTQEIVSYRLRNVKLRHTQGWLFRDIFLVDAPGFSDDKISETRIIKMIHKWHQEEYGGVDHILYLDRITDTRMSGSKSRLIKLIKALTGDRSAESATVSTTMWDTLWNDSQQMKAEATFKEMSERHWKDFINNGAVITKFENTQASALSVLDVCLRTVAVTSLSIVKERDMSKAPYAQILYQNLLVRATSVQQRLELLDLDLAQESTQANDELVEELSRERSEVKDYLECLRGEVNDFGPPPALEMTLDTAMVSEIREDSNPDEGEPSTVTVVERKGLLRRAANRITRSK